MPARESAPSDIPPDIQGRTRVIIEAVRPQVDGGRFFIKRTEGEDVTVTADAFADGHEMLRVVLRWRHVPFGRKARPGRWIEQDMRPAGNDEWTATFEVSSSGWWEYTVQAWVDRFATWRDELRKKHDAGLDVGSELLEGAALIREAAQSAPAGLAARLRPLPEELAGETGQQSRVAIALADDLAADMAAADARPHAVVSAPVLRVRAERVRARYGAWYEMFPRSYTPDASRSATFAEAAMRLPAIAAMGFDIVYLPPIHPIGRTHRKGPNNTLTPGPTDPGSPWAIGGPEGGHTAVEPGLGTLEDFAAFRKAAEREGLEVALDLAYQCSPDHPWVREHPEWFRHRPDGSIKYAENPPKKYQDIYPINFETEQWPELWQALKDVIVFWVDQGVKIFRVDNPHTKPFGFWEWAIAEVQADHPDVLFLSEAFTRPKIMRYLAKLGFTQSYTYFTWRNTKVELTDYFTELTGTDVREYMRPNLFANTPDILHAYLQTGGRPAFQIRLILAATLGASYGIYSGFELAENVPIRPGSEEYLHSEKYEIRPREWDVPDSLAPLITAINRIRRENTALHRDWSLQFHETDNAALLAYSKVSADGANHVLVIVNLDPFNLQHGFVRIAPERLGLPAAGYGVADLLTGDRYRWQGDWNYVRLDPLTRPPAHILRLEA